MPLRIQLYVMFFSSFGGQRGESTGFWSPPPSRVRTSETSKEKQEKHVNYNNNLTRFAYIQFAYGEYLQIPSYEATSQ